jgi:hypothetical protein
MRLTVRDSLDDSIVNVWSEIAAGGDARNKRLESKSGVMARWRWRGHAFMVKKSRWSFDRREKVMEKF